MDQANEKFVDVDGIRTRYFEKGSGEPLVLFHGGNFGSNDAADCSLDWGLNFDGLAQWFHVYAVDKLGQGLTDNPKSDDDYTMAAVVQHALGFLETLKLGNVHLVGHSRGAYLVARMTLERADLIKSVIPVDTNTLAPGVGRNDIVHANAPNPRLGRECQRWVLRALFLRPRPHHRRLARRLRGHRANCPSTRRRWRRWRSRGSRPTSSWPGTRGRRRRP